MNPHQAIFSGSDVSCLFYGPRQIQNMFVSRNRCSYPHSSVNVSIDGTYRGVHPNVFLGE